MKGKQSVATFGIIGASVLGVVVSAITVYEHFRHLFYPESGPSFCSINAAFDCDAVLQSNLATIFGIPLGEYGVLFYLVVIALGSVISRRREDFGYRPADLILALTFVSVVASVGLFIYSKTVIGTLCLLCTSIYILNIFIFICAWWYDTGGIPARLFAGFQDLIRLPALLFSGARSRQRTIALKTVLVGLLLCLAGFSTAPLMSWAVLTSPSLHVKPPGRTPPDDLEKRIDAAFRQWRDATADEIPLVFDGSASTDYARGNPDAPIKVVEFSDFECPHCRMFYFVLESLFAEYAGKIYFVYKNYPLDQACNPNIDREMHVNACYAALFSRCAGQAGKYWNAVDYLFTLQALDEAGAGQEVHGAIDRGAEILGLDRDMQQHCMTGSEQMQKIQSDIQLGDRLGLQGTPSLWVNNRKVEVANEAVLRRIFESIVPH